MKGSTSVPAEGPRSLVTFERYLDSPPWQQVDFGDRIWLQVGSLRLGEYPGASLCLEDRKYANDLWIACHLLWISESSVEAGASSELNLVSRWVVELGRISSGVSLPCIP